MLSKNDFEPRDSFNFIEQWTIKKILAYTTQYYFLEWRSQSWLFNQFAFLTYFNFNSRNIHYLLLVSYILVDMMQGFIIAKIWIYQKDNIVMYL